jgi:nucleotide-binding universal stress UspA family protein
MKKIIVALDALTYNEYALEYAIGVAKRSGGMILGVFLHDLSYVYSEIPSVYEFIPVEYSFVVEKQHIDSKKLDLNIKLFNERCNAENIKHKAHVYDGVNIVEFLIKESVFADLLVLDEHMSFTHTTSDQLSNFIIDIIEDSNCPVLVVPHKYLPVDNVFLCYDGTPSSVNAIKMYSYLFPSWTQKITALVSFNETSTNHLKNSENIKDLLHQHFTNLIIDVENSYHSDAIIVNFFKENCKNGFIVMGARKRSPFSRIFRKSLAYTFIKEIKVPIFIAHN